MLNFKNNYYLNEVQKELPNMLTIKQTARLMRTRKKFALIIGENLHLTNEPEILYIKKYFFSKLSKTTLIILN
jgi:hypothetical protein